MLEEHPFELCVSPFWTGLSRVNTVYFLDQIKTPMLDNNPHSFRHIFGEETPSPFPSQSSPCGLTRVRHLPRIRTEQGPGARFRTPLDALTPELRQWNGRNRRFSTSWGAQGPGARTIVAVLIRQIQQRRHIQFSKYPEQERIRTQLMPQICPKDPFRPIEFPAICLGFWGSPLQPLDLTDPESLEDMVGLRCDVWRANLSVRS